jgi:predicted ABC-class ATPase
MIYLKPPSNLGGKELKTDLLQLALQWIASSLDPQNLGQRRMKIMKKSDELKSILVRIDGKGYRAYKDLEGAYDFGEFALWVDHAQGDPFASPSRVRVQVEQKKAEFSPELYHTRVRAIALQDFLTRKFGEAIRSVVKGARGIGGSGRISIDEPGQEVIARTCCMVNEEKVEVRFTLGLPAAGRTILGRQAADMFFQEIPKLIRSSLLAKNLPIGELQRHIQVVEDQEAIRGELERNQWICFIANGSRLPRRSGVDDRPLQGEGKDREVQVVEFQSPSELEVEVQTRHHGRIKGMAIPGGVTLIVGGGFHGKSTLLNALEKGIYPHIPGDGREFVVVHPAAVKIRAEDGRSVATVDIRSFITHLPLGRETSRFSSNHASGSTSQASNIMEALEVGARVLLIDEDTSATNFMIRDQRMQALVAKDKEPITPFLDRVRQLYQECAVSTVLVMGGSGDYFDVADRVIMMDEYLPRDVTHRAAEIMERVPSQRHPEGLGKFGRGAARVPQPESFNPQKGRRDIKIATQGVKTILYGRTAIDLAQVAQLVDESQTRAIGDMIHYCATHYFNGKISLAEGLKKAMDDLDQKGLDILSPFKRGDYAWPRIFEVAAAINRMRTLKMKEPE